MNRILAIHSGKREESGPCEIYRITTPLYYLDKRPGWYCKWMPFTDFFERTTKQGADETFQWIADTFDAVVWARTYIRNTKEAFESAAYTVRSLRKLGVKQIYEVDDDYSNDHRYVADGDAMKFASWCDAITVTTPYLAEKMKGKTNRPVHVLPNMLDPMLWKSASSIELSADKIRIVLSGSKTHHEDWRPLQGVLHRIGLDYPNVRIMVGGHHPHYLNDITNAEYVPPLPYPYYIEMIKHADIVLAPVDPNDQFNDGKSPIKIIEGMGATRLLDGKAVGAAVIATNNKVYRLGIPTEAHGLLVEHTSEAWEKAIRSLIEDAENRHTLQRNGYNYVWKKLNLDTGWIEWAKAYQRIIKAPFNNKIIKDDKFDVRELVGVSNGSEGQHGHINYPVLSQDLSHISLS